MKTNLLNHFLLLLLLNGCKTEEIIDAPPRPEIGFSSLRFERDFGTENYTIYQSINVRAGNYFKALEVGICWSTKNILPTVADNRLFLKPEIPAAYRSSFTNFELKNLKRDLPHYFRQYIISTTDTLYYEVEKTLIPSYNCDILPSVLPTNEQLLAAPPPNFITSSTYQVATPTDLIFINLNGNFALYNISTNQWEIDKNVSFTFSENALLPETIYYLKPFVWQDTIRAFDFVGKRMLYTATKDRKWQVKKLGNVPEKRTFDNWFKTDSSVLFLAKPENQTGNEYYGEKEIWSYNYASNDFKAISKLSFNSIGINFISSAQSDNKVYVLLNEYLKPTPEIWEFEPFKNTYRKLSDLKNIEGYPDTYAFRNTTNLLFQDKEVIIFQEATSLNCPQETATIKKIPTLRITTNVESLDTKYTYLQNSSANFFLLYPFGKNKIFTVESPQNEFKQLVLN